MKLTRLGDHKQVILMICGPLCDEDSLLPIAQKLKDTYQVVIVTPDGVLPETTYPGAIAFTTALYYQLKINKCTHVRMVFGVSSSCAIVMELAKHTDFDADFYVYESAPFYRVVPFLRPTIIHRLELVVEQVKDFDRETFERILFQDEFVQMLFGKDSSGYQEMIDDVYKVSQYINRTTLQNNILDIVDYPIMRMDRKMMRRSLFVYGMKGPGYKVKDILYDEYPYANFIDIPDRYYLEAMYREPDLYAKKLLYILQTY